MFKKWLIGSLSASAILVVTAAAVLLVLLRIEHNTELSLPAPTGPFNVSRTYYHWVDESRMDSLAPEQGKKRELVVWIWYPAVDVKSASAVYLPAAWRAALEQSQSMMMSGFLMRNLSLVHGHSFTAVKVSPELPAYPVAIMRPDLGALAVFYTALAENLASHGYIVVGIDAPYSASVVVFPDGRVDRRTPSGNPPENISAAERNRRLSRVAAVWSADTRFVLDRLEKLNAGDPAGRFKGRLDLQDVGVIGHSFGGAVAAQFCREDPRCKAGIDMDSASSDSIIREGLDQPFMCVLSDNRATSDPDERRLPGNIGSIRDRQPQGPLCVEIQGMRHCNFSDEALLRDLHASRMFGALGPIDPRRGLEVAAAYICAFFDTHLKSAPSALLEGPSPQYPEVQFESR